MDVVLGFVEERRGFNWTGNIKQIIVKSLDLLFTFIKKFKRCSTFWYLERLHRYAEWTRIVKTLLQRKIGMLTYTCKKWPLILIKKRSFKFVFKNVSIIYKSHRLVNNGGLPLGKSEHFDILRDLQVLIHSSLPLPRAAFQQWESYRLERMLIRIQPLEKL